MGDKIKFERGYYILVFCSGERENGDLHIGKVSNISAIKDPYSDVAPSWLGFWCYTVLFHSTPKSENKNPKCNFYKKLNKIIKSLNLAECVKSKTNCSIKYYLKIVEKHCLNSTNLINSYVHNFCHGFPFRRLFSFFFT